LIVVWLAGGTCSQNGGSCFFGCPAYLQWPCHPGGQLHEALRPIKHARRNGVENQHVKSGRKKSKK